MAGLIVIDFIDMEEHRNNRAVEKRMKDALRHDRARIQVGRISAFGLLEMSRQRIRTGVLESSSIPCPHCAGTGLMRSNSSIALQLLRAVEEALIKSPSHGLNVKTRGQVAMYILNQKRGSLRDVEERFGVAVLIEIDERLAGQTYFQVERGEFVPDDIRLAAIRARGDIIIPETEEDAADEAFVEHDHDDMHESVTTGSDDEDEDENVRNGENPRDNSEAGKRRRRRRRRGGRDREDRPARAEGETVEQVTGSAQTEEGAEGESADPEAAGTEGTSEQDRETRRRRRRGRRGGRRTREEREADAAAGITDDGQGNDTENGDDAAASAEPDSVAVAAAEIFDEAPAKPRRGRKPKVVEAEVAAVVEAAPEAEAPKPRARRGKAKAAETEVVTIEAVSAPEPVAAPEPVVAAPEPEPVVTPPAEPVHMVLSDVDTTKPKRGGWWSRK